jgi:hypothetical protein
MQTRLYGILGIAALTVAASIAAPAATRAETTTYVDGNLAGVAPNTGGTLLFSDEKAMSFRTGLSTVSVPYANITHAELGATKENAHGAPVYKPWKRFGGKTETQLLIVNFKSDAGEEKTMTLEVARSAASGVLSTIHTRTANNPAQEKASEKAEVASAEPTQASSEPVKVASNEPTRKLSKKEAAKEAKEAKLQAQRDAELAAANARSENPAGWWGDNFWKTTRNSEKWNAKAPASSPNNEQR